MKVIFKSLRFSFSLTKESGKMIVPIYMLCKFLSTSSTLFQLFFLGKILDYISCSNFSREKYIGYIGGFAIVYIMMHAFPSIQNLVRKSAKKKNSKAYQCILAEKINSLPMEVIDSIEGRNLVDDVHNAEDFVADSSLYVVDFLFCAYAFIVAFSTIFSFSKLFSSVFIILTAPGIFVNLYFGRKAEQFRREKAPDMRRFCYYRWMLTDAWPAKDIRTYDLTEQLKCRYDNEKEKYRSENKKLDKCKLKYALFSEVIMRSGEIIFLIYVLFCAFKGIITVGQVILLSGFLVTIFSSVRNMVSIGAFFYAKSSELMSRFFMLMDIESEKRKIGKKVESFESLVFDNVCFRYPFSEQNVLDGVSFSINRGDRLSILGINGAGKSTIVKLIIGMYKVTSGQIFLNGLPIDDYDICDVRRLFSVLFQNYIQYPLSIRDNVTLSDYSRSDKDREIIESLKKAKVYDDIKLKLTRGFDTEMSRMFADDGLELSKGQWQKIALARAYFKNSDVIILDEPSASLDAESEERVFSDFANISHSKTAIMISHRISAATSASAIIVLNEGKIVEQGTHDELIRCNGTYAELYNIQREKYRVGVDAI